MDIPLRRNRVFRNRLKTCFQSKSDVMSSAPHRVLKNSNEESAGDILLVGWRSEMRVMLHKARRRRESPSDAIQYSRLLLALWVAIKVILARRRSFSWSSTSSCLQLPDIANGLVV